MNAAEHFRKPNTHGTINPVSLQESSAEQRFGLWVRSIRAAQGLSQRELAALMEAAGHRTWMQTTVTKTEAGKRPLRVDEFVDLCQLLEANPVDVMGHLVDEHFDRNLRFTELSVTLHRAQERAEALSTESEHALAELQAARAALDEFAGVESAR